jgi:GNAT superfamily N-acetyltransferase
MASPSPPRFQAFSLSEDPNGLWTAIDDEPVGFAWAWVCEDFWFLAQLFVKPRLQAHDVGRELLRRALEHADTVGARQRALITFAFNTVSQGLYIRHGFIPRFPIYFMRVDRM